MLTKNMLIGTRLRLGFAGLLFFVLVLGVVSYLQTEEIHQQIETMYNHPLQVRRAIGRLHADILAIHRDMKDVFLSADEKEIAEIQGRIKVWESDAFAQIQLIYDRYLGPRMEVDSVQKEFIIYNAMREETLRLVKASRAQEAFVRTKREGIAGRQVELILKNLGKIDKFAIKKGDDLFKKSEELNNSLNMQLILMTGLILLLSLFISMNLYRNIRRPLEELTQATTRFHNGDLAARSIFESRNEFGKLAISFNRLAESVQANLELSKKTETLANAMLKEEDMHLFFSATLEALAECTGSEVAAVYLLSDDKMHFEHFASIGTDNNARQRFDAPGFEGEFGAVLSSGQVQHISGIPDDTRFAFHTVTGKFIPREIITIPVVSGSECIAVISLASLRPYGKQALQLVNNILVTLGARTEGILAHRKMKQLTHTLQDQNRELEAQKSELAAQSSELIEQNTELEMQKKQLFEASSLKTSFLSNMSHELRTPLNSVIALSGVLNRRLANMIPEEEYSYLEVIERNGKHLLSLINDILDIARIEAGREEVEISKFNVNNLIAEVVSMIRPQGKQKDIELLHKAGSTIISVTSDAGKCRHILQNLIGNAVKFTEKGKVEVTAGLSDGTISITVSDTGIGISEDHLTHIFDEFRQADGSTSRRFGGTGLGLAIAKKYANLLGGAILVKSVQGKGSEFTLTLPSRYSSEREITVTEESTGFKQPDEQMIPRRVLGSPVKTILLVEDSEPAIIQIKDILEESGYQVLVARDGGEAIAGIAQTVPDAMILDLMMPGIDGFDVLKTVRENEQTSKVPVLILTAKHITKEELKFLKRNNVHQLIQKGDIKRAELLNAVASMVLPPGGDVPKTKPTVLSGTDKPVVLVVEDNPDNMTTVKALLSDNYSVIEAVNGQEAIELAKEHIPHLILMDIALPVMDGIEAFKAIRRLPQLQHAPIIALTASAMTEDRETILAYGFNAYISKPIDQHIFFKTIDGALYGKS